MKNVLLKYGSDYTAKDDEQTVRKQTLQSNIEQTKRGSHGNLTHLL